MSIKFSRHVTGTLFTHLCQSYLDAYMEAPERCARTREGSSFHVETDMHATASMNRISEPSVILLSPTLLSDFIGPLYISNMLIVELSNMPQPLQSVEKPATHIPSFFSRSENHVLSLYT